MRLIFPALAAGFIMLAVGCKSTPKEENVSVQSNGSAPAEDTVVNSGERIESPSLATAVAASGDSGDKKADLSPTGKRRMQLRDSYLELHCLRRSSGSEKDLKIYEKFGFESAAEWTRAWHAEAETNAEWASRIVAEAVELGCSFKRGKEKPKNDGSETGRSAVPAPAEPSK